MKSQLLQSCQGCVPSTIGPILTFPTGKEKSPNDVHVPIFFKERSVIITSLNTTRMNFHPLVRVREGPTSCCFFTAKGGLFERPKAAFLNHAGCCRHARHGVGGGGDDTEENEFSGWRHRRHKKAKPTTSAMAFCVNIVHK